MIAIIGAELPNAINIAGNQTKFLGTEYDMAYEPEAGMLYVRHRRTNDVRLVSVAGACLKPAPSDQGAVATKAKAPTQPRS